MPPIPLHLTDADPPLAISAADFLARLQSRFSSLESLCEEFHCTPEDVASTLEDSSTLRLLQIKTKLALMQAQATAIQYMPQAMAQLKTLAETSEKPEVARRATTTLINIAGLPTTTEKRPAPPPPPDPKAGPYIMPVPSKTDEEYNQRLGYVGRMTMLQRGHGMDINLIPWNVHDLFIQTMEDFFKTHHIPINHPFADPPPRHSINHHEQNPDDPSQIPPTNPTS